MNELRERFIEDAKQANPRTTLDFRVSTAKGQEGRFLDKKTHQMWLGYEIAHRAPHYRATEEEYQSAIMGKYIIGNHVGPGVKLMMSHKPMVHGTKRTAFEEANRLTTEYGGPYAVFRCVKTFERVTECEESSS